MRNDIATPPARRTGIQAIARAGAVLRALEASPDGLGLAELANAVQLPKSTVHRLVAALAAEELVSAPTGAKIQLGGALGRLGAASASALRDTLRPLLEDLNRRLDETVDLAVLDGASVRFVEQLPARQRLLATSAVGARFPLHCTANGKALLAAMPAELALATLPRRLPRMTPATLTSRAELLAELEQIRSTGVAFDREEHTEGICAVGAAVLDRSGPVAAISVPVPAQRFAGRQERYAAGVLSAARAASRRLAVTVR